jgi:hypothetical protein
MSELKAPRDVKDYSLISPSQRSSNVTHSKSIQGLSVQVYWLLGSLTCTSGATCAKSIEDYQFRIVGDEFDDLLVQSRARGNNPTIHCV